MENYFYYEENYTKNVEKQIQTLKESGFIIDEQTITPTRAGGTRIKIKFILPGFTGTTDELKALKQEILNSWFIFDEYDGEKFYKFTTDKTPYNEQIIMRLQQIGWNYLGTGSEKIFFCSNKINSIYDKMKNRILIKNILQELKDKYSDRIATIQELKGRIEAIENLMHIDEQEAKEYNDRIQRLKNGEVHLICCNWYSQNASKGAVVPNSKNEKLFESYEFCLVPETTEDYEALNNKDLIGKSIPKNIEIEKFNINNRIDTNLNIYYEGGYMKFISQDQLIVVKVVGDFDI